MWLDLIPIALLNPPSRLRALGFALTNAAGLFLVVGLVGQVTVAAMSGAMGLVTSAPKVFTLVQPYPALPTWWIPEGPLGCVLCTTTLGVGIVLSNLGAKVQRLMH